MLKPKALAKVLEQTNTNGVRNTVLLNSEGSLLAFAGEDDRDAKVRAAISSSIWLSYEKAGKQFAPPGHMTQMILPCMDGSVVINRVPGGLLCLFAGKGVGLGMLRLKADKMAAHLEEPLKKLGT
ncbi:ragulator complex protein LAMTOR2 homolog [Sycon ciliatum]|uniref:ragulator complex protein LAMTOR2 homolog n=1 Tax=Sycon ciliatum TaxID=27933 RepID=UPI0020AACC73|eukprot:scpid103593/ scgid23913/ Ragulator complex protein LAMTOR2 homolog